MVATRRTGLTRCSAAVASQGDTTQIFDCKTVKILLYSANYAPEPTGIGKYSGEMAEWLTQQGHEVRVVAAPPYYPDWKIAEGYAWPPYRTETLRGVRVWRAPLWVPRQPSGLKRVVHLLTFALSSAPVMLRQALWQPDVVVTVAPAIVCAPMGCLTARLCGARSWLHVQDFEVDVAFGMGLIQGGSLLKRFALGCERFLMKRFDAVSSISNRMVERLVSKGVASNKAHLFPNWVDIDVIRPIAHVSSYRKELGIPADAKVVLYSGSLGAKHGLSIIPEAARRLAHRSDIYFVICGDGVMKAELEASLQGLPNARMLPLQPFERLNELLGMADVHVLPQCAGAEDLVLPSKMTGMLSSGRPVVATCTPESELGRVVAQCGLVTPPADVTAFADAVLRLADSPEQRAALGLLARRYAVEYLSADGVLGKFVAKAHKLIGTEQPFVAGGVAEGIRFTMFDKTS
jgi:colanic acid biosynthesis glycosyl transferase WcaI